MNLPHLLISHWKKKTLEIVASSLVWNRIGGRDWVKYINLKEFPLGHTGLRTWHHCSCGIGRNCRFSPWLGNFQMPQVPKKRGKKSCIISIFGLEASKCEGTAAFFFESQALWKKRWKEEIMVQSYSFLNRWSTVFIKHPAVSQPLFWPLWREKLTIINNPNKC